MPRIAKVKNQATTPTMEEVAEKPIVQQIMEAFDENQLSPNPRKQKPRSHPKKRHHIPRLTERPMRGSIMCENTGQNPDVSFKQAMVNAKATYKNA